MVAYSEFISVFIEYAWHYRSIRHMPTYMEYHLKRSTHSPTSIARPSSMTINKVQVSLIVASVCSEKKEHTVGGPGLATHQQCVIKYYTLLSAIMWLPHDGCYSCAS